MWASIEHARDYIFDEGNESRRPLPSWLKWCLTLLILLNIAAYAVATCHTLFQINEQIAILDPDGQQQSHDAKEMHSPKPKFHATTTEQLEQSNADEVQVLKKRKRELITGAIIEVVLDLIDLIDVFLGSFIIHIMYLVVKLFSLGMWSYSQVHFRTHISWLFPLCLCLLIVLIMVRHFTALRKWLLALCILVSTVAWVAIVIIRVTQISTEVASLEYQLDGNKTEQEKVRLKRRIEHEHLNRIIIILGSSFMVLSGTMGLLAECFSWLWTGITFGILHAVGFLACICYICVDRNGHDVLFVVPLIYSILICAIFIIYLFEQYHQAGRNQKHASKPPPPIKLVHRHKATHKTHQKDSTKGQAKSRKSLIIHLQRKGKGSK